MSKKKIQPLNLSEQVIKLLKKKAQKEDRSMSSMANRILEKELLAKKVD